MSEQVKKIMEDFNLDYDPEKKAIRVIVTMCDGSIEKPFSLRCGSTPRWVYDAYEYEDDYEDDYDQALDALHRHGYYLSGEVD